MTDTARRTLPGKDLTGGALMLALGMATAVHASDYDVGSLRRMGPGFFPLALGVILAAVGTMIMLTRQATPRTDARVPEWRGWLCICASIAAFIFLGTHGGLVPATFAIVFIAALGDRQNTLLSATVLAAIMTAICVAVFWWLLKVPFPLFRWG